MKSNKYIRTYLSSFTAYSSARDEYKLTAEVYLDANENPNNNGLNRYPDNQSSRLREMLASQHELSAAEILVTNGSDEAIDLCIRAICEPKVDTMLYFSPSYGMYKVLAETHQVGCFELNLNPNFLIDLEALETILAEKKLKLICLCNPNNPTGNVFNCGAVVRLAEKYNCFVLIDEAYIEFCPMYSSTALLSKFNNLLITRTLSKAYGLAGIRIGYCMSSKEVINALSSIQLPYSVSTLSQAVAEDALQNQIRIKKFVEEVNLAKEYLSNALAKLSFVKKVYPSEANFLLLEVANANALYQYLLNKGIVIRNRDSQLKNCLRVSIGTSTENQKLISTLYAYEKEKSTVLG